MPSVADECFRDLVRCIEDARGNLMRARHRLSKFLLRRGERYPGPGRAWTAKHIGWLRAHELGDACSQATFVTTWPRSSCSPAVPVRSSRRS